MSGDRAPATCDRRTTGLARAILVLLVLSVVTVLLPPLIQVRWLRLAAVLCSLLQLLAVASLGFRLATVGEGRISRGLLLLVGLYLCGAGAIEIWLALLVVPATLSWSYPCHLVLLEEGIPEGLAVAASLGLELLLLLALGALWTAFLAHRERLILASQSRSAGSGLAFLRTATGGAHLTTRQWLFPVSFRELPEAAPVLWLATAMLLGMAVMPWMSGLRELGLHMPWWATAALAVLLPIALYFSWLLRHAPRDREHTRSTSGDRRS